MNKLIPAALVTIGLGLSASVAAADGSSALTMKPKHGISFDVGTKHVIGYFLNDNNLCNLTLMVAEAFNGDDVPSETAARFEVAIDAGKTARLDTAEGKSLEFACMADAQAMSVKALEQVAVYSRPAE
jgi:hypothetical protein